jgi:hypothetical protein
MSRRVYLLGIALTLVALAFIVTDALLWEPGVTAANARRIRVGMTFDEVDAILGPMLPDERKAFEVSKAGPEGSKLWMRIISWCGPDGEVVVHFDKNWRVAFVNPLLDDRPAERSGLLARLRAWLGW